MSERVSVAIQYTAVEVVELPAEPAPSTDVLPWRSIFRWTAVGAAAGLVAVLTTQGIESWPTFVASAIDVAAGLGIIGGLWAATFLSVD